MTTHPSLSRSLRAAAAGFALLAAVGLAGCGSSSKSARAASNDARSAAGLDRQEPQLAAQPTAQANPPAKGGSSTKTQTVPAVTERSIIHTGEITVRVHDVDREAARAESFATGAGGYVGGDDRSIDAGRSSATLTLRVPAARFDATLAAVAGLGTEESRTVSTQDVTNQVIDVAARLRTQQASVDRVRALLAQAKTIGEIVSIESELTRREADLESLEAQQAHLGDLTALSTITATLLGPEAQVAAHPTKHTGFLEGLRRGWQAFLASITWLVAVLGAILPFAVAIGLIGWLARRLVRSIKRRAALAGAGTPGSPPTPGADEGPQNPA